MTHDYTIRQKQRLHRFGTLPLRAQGEKASGIARGIFHGACRRIRTVVRAFVPFRLRRRTRSKIKSRIDLIPNM